MTPSAPPATSWLPVSAYVSDLQSAGVAFHELVLAPVADRGRQLAVLADIESRADVSYVGLIQRAESSALLWSEREALYQLLACIDSVLDELGAAGSLLTAYELESLPPLLAEQSATIVGLSTGIRAAVERWQQPHRVGRGTGFPVCLGVDDLVRPAPTPGQSSQVGADAVLARQHTTLMDLVGRAVANLQRLANAVDG